MKPSAQVFDKPHLIIDTAHEILSLGVVQKGKITATFQEPVFREMASRLQSEAQNVMDRAGVSWPDLVGVLLNAGPGSFTSIRIGLAVAKALELSLGISLYGFNGLQALAWQHKDKNLPMSVLLEAAGQDVYCQHFTPEGIPTGRAVACSYEEAGKTMVKDTLTIGNVQCVALHQSTADLSSFWALYLEGYGQTPPVPFYVRPLTYKKIFGGVRWSWFVSLL